MVYHSSEAVLHNRENLFDLTLDSLAAPTKVLGCLCCKTAIKKKKTLFEALSHLKCLFELLQTLLLLYVMVE